MEYDNPEKVKSLIPHREPFLYVDQIETVSENKIVGSRTYTDSDYFFKGHFPAYPVVPGVILVESMAQCGGAGVRAMSEGGQDAIAFLASIDKVKFRKQVRPGDTVRFEVENLRVSPKVIKQRGCAYVGEEIAAEAEWLCVLSDQSALAD